MYKSKILKKVIHYCGSGFKGAVVTRKTVFLNKVKTLKFCDLCGKEMGK